MSFYPFNTLSLHPTAPAAFHQGHDVVCADAMEVARNRVLQAGSGRGEVERILSIAIVIQPIDQPGGAFTDMGVRKFATIEYILNARCEEVTAG